MNCTSKALSRRCAASSVHSTSFRAPARIQKRLLDVGVQARPGLTPLVVARSSAPDADQFDLDKKAAPQQIEGTPESLGPRDDDVLPQNLGDAVASSAMATANAIKRSNNWCTVEIHLPEFWDPISGAIFPNKGDQERFWKMTRRFVEELSAELGETNIKAVYPDAGVAAMLAHQWKGECNFKMGSLTDRRPVQADDEVIVVACPDPQGAEECMKMVGTIMDQDEKAGRAEGRPVILFNPRLSSGDVGLGLNARRIRENFTKRFVVTYSLRPIGDFGSVFKMYPDLWKVFLEDEEFPGRYKLVAERPERPAGDSLDYLIREVETRGSEIGPDGKPVQRELTMLDKVANVVSGLRSFARALSG